MANEGRAGKDIGNNFMDPPGTLTIIQRERHGNPSEQFMDFSAGESR